MIVLVVVAVLITAGVVRLNQRRGVGGVTRAKRLVPQIEQHDQQIDDLAMQKLRATERLIEEQYRNSANKQLDPSYPIYYPPSDR